MFCASRLSLISCFQACQGDDEDELVTDSSNIRRDYGAASIGNNSPKHADFLIATATTPDYVSYRDKKKGAIFIQNLCDILSDPNCSKDDLASNLTRVKKVLGALP